MAEGGIRMGRKIKLGVIGTGKIGRLHLDSVINYIPDAQVVCVVDPFMSDETRAWLAENGVSSVSGAVEDVFTDSQVEAVMILSPTNTHAELIIQAARAGKHIFCEKPVDFDLEKILAALREVKKTGVKFQIGFNRRYDHNFRKIREIVESGAIGDPHITKISSRDPAPPPMEYVKSSGGIFMDQMIHDFDMIRYLTGKEAAAVFSRGSVQIDKRIGDLGDVDTAVVTIEFEDGTIGVIDNSRQAVYGYDQRAEVFGSKGVCMTDNDTDTRVSTVTAAGTLSDIPPYFFLQRYFQAYVDEMKSFVLDLQEGRDPACGLIDAVRPVVMAKAAAESLRTGQLVEVEDILSSAEINSLTN